MSQCVRHQTWCRRLLGALFLLGAAAGASRAADDAGTASFTLPGVAAPVGQQADPTGKALAKLDPAPAPSQKGLPNAYNGLLWKATLAGNTVYLLGSIHAASPGLYPLPKFIEAAFRRSSVLLVEMNVDRLTQQQKRDLAGPYALYPAGDSLWNHVSPELRKVIESIWCETRTDCETVALMRPWALAFAGVPTTNGIRSTLGIDRHFLNAAAAGRIPVGELESGEELLKTIASLSESAQEKLLLQTIRTTRGNPQYEVNVQTAWMRGDADWIEAATANEFSDMGEVQKILIDDRNVHMADVVEQYLRAGKAAFAVMGASHLIGGSGVVRRLQDRGYNVERIFALP